MLHVGGAREREREKERERKGEKEREKERERERECVCVCERERDRERVLHVGGEGPRLGEGLSALGALEGPLARMLPPGGGLSIEGLDEACA